MKVNYSQEFIAGSFYHIYNKCPSNMKLFIDNEDYELFLKSFDFYFNEVFAVLGYCLIPNHFHFVVQLNEIEKLKIFAKESKTKLGLKFSLGEISENTFVSDQFKRFFSSYALKYKHKYNHEGAVFLNNFKRIKILDHMVSRKILYVHHNPIHHYLKKDYESWLYSSYIQYKSNSNSTLKVNTEIGNSFFENFTNEHLEYKLLPEDE